MSGSVPIELLEWLLVMVGIYIGAAALRAVTQTITMWLQWAERPRD